MSTSSRARAIRAARTLTPPAPLVDPLQVIKDKFTRLTSMRSHIAAAKELYKAQDALIEELLPCFITITDTEFIVKRQIVIGDKTYRLHPSFFDISKNKAVAKQFKAAFHPTMTIE
jgi:hypothetical protein